MYEYTEFSWRNRLGKVHLKEMGRLSSISGEVNSENGRLPEVTQDRVQ
jgi:hypothetical protein